MIILKLQGGLGNQMFQFAFGYVVSKKLDTSLLLDTSFYKNNTERKFLLNVFKIDFKEASLKEIETVKLVNSHKIQKSFYNLFNRTLPLHKKSVVEQQNFNFDANLFKVNKNCLISGYFQSELFFKEFSSDIRDFFHFYSEPNIYYKSILEEAKKRESISIHVRRGDYVSNSETNEYHGTLSLDYYHRAIELIKNKTENPFFILISDDINWCKKEFNLSNCIFVENNRGADYDDLHVLSSTKHNIIANSTFSWWGAWLNKHPEKIVIAPKQWFANQQLQQQTQDLLPESWIKL